MNKQIKEFNHVDLMWPSNYLAAGDLRGKEVTVIIDDIEPRHELVGTGGKKDKKPVLWLRTPSGRKIDKAMVCNKTNGRSIASMYGTEITEWIGKAITIRAEPEPKSPSGEAIRVKRERPRVKPTREPPHDPQTGEVSGDDRDYLDEQSTLAAAEMGGPEE